MMREHGPETPQCLGGNAGTELRDIALQICADEVAPPFHAEIVGRGEKAARKAAAHPEGVHFRRLNLEHIERAKLQVRYAPRQTLARLPKQIHRRGAEKQKAAIRSALSTAPVDNAAQWLE